MATDESARDDVPNDHDPVDASSNGTEAAAQAFSQVAAWLAMGLVNVVIGALAIPSSRSGLVGRLTLHLYDMGQMLALGLVAAGLVLAWHRWGPQRTGLGYGVLASGAIVVSQWLLVADLRGASRILGLEAWQIWSRVFAALFATCVPLAAWLSLRLGRGKLRLPLLVAGLLLAAGHQLVLPNLYLGIHTYGTWCAAMVVAGALAPSARRWVGALRALTPRTRWFAAAGAALLALAALLVPAPTSVRSQLHMLPGAVVARYKPELFVAGTAGEVPQDQADWYRDRSQLPPIPPSGPRLLPDDAIVVLLVCDAMRADVINGPDVDELPVMADLKARGANFTHVWSPAPNTNPAVAALNAGKYPAQIHWKLEAVGKHPRLWPDDPSPRLGDILAQAKIASVGVVSKPMAGLEPKYGLTQGIGLEIPARNQHSEAVVPAFLKWLDERELQGPLFAYVHVTDAHAPYNLGGKHDTKRAGYLAELRVIDRSLGKLVSGLRSRGLEDRTLLILTADHGEAFGEHNSWFHGTTVYEELVRVPLIIVGEPVEPRSIDTHVTTLDLAPTIFDMFGVATPPTYMGQSLVPLLRGEDPQLARPIFLDSHADVSGMVFPDGLKLVVKHGTPELYDLNDDPDELDNIYDTRPDAAQRYGEYRRFVEVHDMEFEKG